ncbi:MAG TPA: TorF family putative porin [Steroidobacteraceae bacterium]|nr:TorF family putative porin [Steroidobacteraceae bacterium]
MQASARRQPGARWAAALLAMLVMGAARGADLQGSLGASSDNVFRGLSLSDEQPSLLADVHASGTQWFGGVAADTVRLAPRERTSAQLIGYLGYQYAWGPGLRSAWSVRHYDYVSSFRNRYDYDEVDATLSWQERLSVRLIGSPDTYQVSEYRRYGRGAAFAAELSGREPLPYALSVQLGAGYYDLRQEVGAGYVYWSAALSEQWDAWSFTVSYIGTDAGARRLFGPEADGRLVASAVWSF